MSKVSQQANNKVQDNRRIRMAIDKRDEGHKIT